MLEKVQKSLIFTDSVFKNICSVKEMPPGLIKHFDDTFDIKEFKKIAKKMNIKIKSGTEKLLMSQLCQIYCALVNIVVKSKMVKKGSMKKKKKSKKKNKKGGMQLQDEYGNYLEDRQRSVIGEMMNYVKRNWIQISIILFNMYVIYLAYTDLKRLLDTGITFSSQQFESSGLVVYNENDNLVAILNTDMVELERVSILDLILHYTEVAPKLQTALIQEYNDRVEEYTGKIKEEARGRSRNLRMDVYEELQEGVGIDDEGTVNHLRFLYAAMNPSAVTTRVTEQTLKQGRRQMRDFWIGLDREIEDMRTGITDYAEDEVSRLFYIISRDTYLLFWSGMFFVGLMIRFIVSMRSNSQENRNQRIRHAYNVGRDGGIVEYDTFPLLDDRGRNKKSKRKKSRKKSKKKSKKLRR